MLRIKRAAVRHRSVREFGRAGAIVPSLSPVMAHFYRAPAPIDPRSTAILPERPIEKFWAEQADA